MQELLSQFCIEGLKVREASEVDVLRLLAQCLWLPSPSGERASAWGGEVGVLGYPQLNNDNVLEGLLWEHPTQRNLLSKWVESNDLLC